MPSALVYGAAFSPDDDAVIITSEDRAARLRHKSGAAVLPMRGYGRSIRSAAFSPDGETIVTASADRNRAAPGTKIGQPLPEPARPQRHGHQRGVQP